MPQEFPRLARLLTTLAGLTVLAACGGGGGGFDPSVGNGNGNGSGNNGGATVTVSGKITFDRLVFSTTPGGGLNPNNPIESPARDIVVQAVISNGSVATTTTDANGDFSLTVPANTNMFIRARAEMIKGGSAPTWTFAVRDNTEGDAVYVLDGSSFNSGTTAVTRNLKAPSDWNGSGYNPGRRAAPFAILDTVYQAKQLILDANRTAQFPPLNLYWSEDNKDEANAPFCPDTGNIRTSFYGVGQRDQCTTQGAPVPDGIYILGFFGNGNGDTDEYDAHVIAHEFGHYFEDQFSRSDSVGGQHSLGDRLDLRVAFGEGWGNAFGAMALNDPQYRDSAGGISQDSGFNLESGTIANPGWFSEASVGQFLWDVFDSGAEPGDSVALGFTPIYTVMTTDQINTDALTSIYSFASALRARNTGAAAGIATLLSAQRIASNPDAFGTGETNNGGIPSVLPVYVDLALNQPQAGICTTAVAGSKNAITDGFPNRLGNHRFFRFVNDTARVVTIQAQGAAATVGTVDATDPEIYVFRRGDAVLTGNSSLDRVETISGQQLPAGTYVIDVFDYAVTGTDPTPRCMTVSIAGS